MYRRRPPTTKDFSIVFKAQWFCSHSKLTSYAFNDNFEIHFSLWKPAIDMPFNRLCPHRKLPFCPDRISYATTPFYRGFINRARTNRFSIAAITYIVVKHLISTLFCCPLYDSPFKTHTLMQLTLTNNNQSYYVRLIKYLWVVRIKRRG